MAKVIKIAEYAEQITDQFEQRINILDDFHSKNLIQLEKLTKLPLSR